MFDRRGNRKYVNDAERRAFFRAAKQQDEKARRAFCFTLFYTGCRISEALNVTTGRVDISHKAIVFETLKRRQRGIFRAVPIPESLVALLREICAEADTSARVWKISRPTAYRLIKQCMSKARIRGAMASPKGLRHGFAIACIGKNIPLPTVQRWLGHARLETTAIYLGASGEEERKFARRLWFNE
jgi:integrase